MNESLEMYLETILILSNELESVRAIDIAKKLNYSKPSISKAMNILREREYIIIENNNIELTKKGNLIANGYVWAKSGVAYLGDKDYFNCYNNEMQLFLNGSQIFSVAPDGDVMSKGSVTSEDYK